MKKSVFAAEFEERTGCVFYNLVDGLLTIRVYCSRIGIFEFQARTICLYSRAHLEAAIAAAGEKGAER